MINLQASGAATIPAKEPAAAKVKRAVIEGILPGLLDSSKGEEPVIC